jgi:hypothetical protein
LWTIKSARKVIDGLAEIAHCEGGATHRGDTFVVGTFANGKRIEVNTDTPAKIRSATAFAAILGIRS